MSPFSLFTKRLYYLRLYFLLTKREESIWFPGLYQYFIRKTRKTFKANFIFLLLVNGLGGNFYICFAVNIGTCCRTLDLLVFVGTGGHTLKKKPDLKCFFNYLHGFPARLETREIIALSLFFATDP